MTTDNTASAPLLEVRHPDVDTDSVMAHINERIAQRHARMANAGQTYNRAVRDADWFDLTEESKLEDLYQLIGQAAVTMQDVVIAPTLVDNTPGFLRPLLDRLRRAAHNLVIYYVNMLAGRQLAVERSLMMVSLSLAGELEQSLTRIEQLEQEVAGLRTTLAQPQDNASGAHKKVKPQ